MDLTKKINKFAERFWLVIAVCSTVAVVVFRLLMVILINITYYLSHLLGVYI